MQIIKTNLTISNCYNWGDKDWKQYFRTKFLSYTDWTFVLRRDRRLLHVIHCKVYYDKLRCSVRVMNWENKIACLALCRKDELHKSSIKKLVNQEEGGESRRKKIFAVQ